MLDDVRRGVQKLVTSGAELMKLEGMSMLTDACPDCGSQLEFAEGCGKFHVCGYSECGDQCAPQGNYS
jgi:hypothetical protein